MEQEDYIGWMNEEGTEHPTHWAKPEVGEGMLLVDDEGGVYNPWYLEWCLMSALNPENKDIIGWHAEMGVYTDLVEACNKRLLFMEDHPDRYYRIRQSNGWHNNAPLKELQ